MHPEKAHPATTPISFWLVPAEPTRQELTILINFLADRYHAPRFLPHVTVLSTHLTKDESRLQILQTATKGIPPIKLDILGLEHGPDRFKSVFIRLNSRPVLPLHAALRACCRHPGNYRLDAHLSLFYRQLPLAQRMALLSELQMPQGSVLFNTVIAVAPGQNQSSFDDVEKWRLTEQVGLSAW